MRIKMLILIDEVSMLSLVVATDLKTKREFVDQEDLEEDFTLLNKMAELTTKLTCLHEVSDLLNL